MGHFRILSAATVICLIVAPAFSQEAGKSVTKTANRSTNPCDWPSESDALIAAPKNHKLLLENDRVRVLDVTLAPGETENVHSHRWPSVLYLMSAGDFVDRDGEGHVIFDTRSLQAPMQLPFATWKEPEAAHSIENLSKTVTIHLIRVEIKRDSCKSSIP